MLKFKAKVRGYLYRAATQPELSFRLFITGFVIFLCGAGAILYAEARMPSSVAQELLATVGLVLAVGGVLTTLTGYLRIGAGRLLRFFFD